MREIAIQMQDVHKIYNIYSNQKERFLGLFAPNKYGKEFCALHGVNLCIEKGESIGLIGLNGSGKSTLVNLIGGCILPTEGEVRTVGRISSIAVFSGMDVRLTGLENIVLKGLLQGFDKEEIERLKPSIIEFSELGDFISQPVKKYSSGMRAKLGFSIATCIDPDILIVDEALAVGDPTFSNKCIMKMKEFKARGKTIIFVSHNLPQIKAFCDRVVWLEGGSIREVGETAAVIQKYSSFVNIYNKLPVSEREIYINSLSSARTIQSE